MKLKLDQQSRAVQTITKILTLMVLAIYDFCQFLTNILTFTYFMNL